MSELHLRNFHYTAGGPLELSIAAGECVCLSGPSGAGKTLLLRALADLDRHSGELRLNEQDCHSLAAPQWRRRVGLLGTESRWWEEQVGAHFSVAAQKLENLLTPLGFGPEVFTWQVQRLSSGERQRLALARLLANQPEVLLLDEPTANLDAANAEKVETLLHEYRRRTQAAVLWVSHNTEQIARVADRHFHLQQARLNLVI